MKGKAMEKEHATMTCPICKAVGETEVVEKAKSYTMHLCLTCDTVFAEPMKHPGASWYQDAFSPIPLLDRALDTVRQPKLLLRGAHYPFFDDLPNRGGFLLDCGCGEGEFLAVVSKDYAVTGIDIRETAIARARSRYGLKDVHAATVEEFFKTWKASGKARYDVVTLFDVLEHLYDPSSSIDMIGKMIKPGGWLAITLPNRRRWPNLFVEEDHPPNHLTRWSKRALRGFLEAHSFEVKKLKDFNERGLLASRTTSPLTRLVRYLLSKGGRPTSRFSGPVVHKGSSQHSKLLWLLGWAWIFRLQAGSIADFPIYSLLRMVGAPGQMLYCLAIKAESCHD